MAWLYQIVPPGQVDTCTLYITFEAWRTWTCGIYRYVLMHCMLYWFTVFHSRCHLFVSSPYAHHFVEHQKSYPPWKHNVYIYVSSRRIYRLVIILTHMYHKSQVNVGKYTIHGSVRNCKINDFTEKITHVTILYGPNISLHHFGQCSVLLKVHTAVGIVRLMSRWANTSSSLGT